jgi:cation:H+ antiporter
MVVAAVVLVGLLSDDGLSRTEGLALVAGIVGYVLLHLWLASSGRRDPDLGAEGGASAAPGRRWLPPAMIVAGLGALLLGGYLVVHGGVELAEGLGVSNAVIALTVVAVGTSLPELSTSIVAAARKHGDIAVGNVVGSNIFNVFSILGITATIHPLVRGGVGWDDLGVMAAVSVLVVPLAWTGLRLGRREGAFLLASYVAYCAWRFA